MPAVAIYGDREKKTTVHTHIPLTMRDKLVKRALRNHRTITREVIAIVEEALKLEEAAQSQ